MRRRLAAGALALLAAATAEAVASPPREGVLVTGTSLGGISLGATEAQVRTAWGDRFGRCRNCARTTWYFNARKFEPQGAAVEFRSGRAAAIFTLWSPRGWRTQRGLRLGDDGARVGVLHGPVVRVECGRYYALIRPGATAVTAFYVVDEKVWGFGLSRPGVPVCR